MFLIMSIYKVNGKTYDYDNITDEYFTKTRGRPPLAKKI